MNEIEKAKEFLKLKGYFTNILWNTDDVTMNYDCTEEQAMRVLERVFNNEYVNEQIFESIKIIADSMNLKPKE
jgi:hypothetical protein